MNHKAAIRNVKDMPRCGYLQVYFMFASGEKAVAKKETISSERLFLTIAIVKNKCRNRTGVITR